VVTLNAASAGCPDANPRYRFYLRSPTGVWSIVKNFSTSGSFRWDTRAYVPGTYLIGVWVKDAKSGFTYDTYAFGTFTLQRLPCTSVNVGSILISPQVPGTTISFGATANGCPDPMYQWWVQNTSGVWNMVAQYPAPSIYSWNTTGLPTGTYQIGVWAKQAGYSNKPYEAFSYVTYKLWSGSPGGGACDAVNLSAVPSSPSVTGPVVTLTASPVTCTSPEYKWWVRDTAAHWTVVRNYSSSDTYDFNTATRKAGTYLLGVWARQSGSTANYEAYSFITFTLTVPPRPDCTSVTIAPSPASPQSPGAIVTFSANSLGCQSPTFQFWVLPPGGTWTIAQAFSTTPYFSWNTDGSSPGPWQIGVWARHVGSTKSYEAFAFITFQLTFG
jgi:hypothetical protein